MPGFLFGCFLGWVKEGSLLYAYVVVPDIEQTNTENKQAKTINEVYAVKKKRLMRSNVIQETLPNVTQRLL